MVRMNKKIDDRIDPKTS